LKSQYIITIDIICGLADAGAISLRGNKKLRGFRGLRGKKYKKEVTISSRILIF